MTEEVLAFVTVEVVAFVTEEGVTFVTEAVDFVTEVVAFVAEEVVAFVEPPNVAGVTLDVLGTGCRDALHTLFGRTMCFLLKMTRLDITMKCGILSSSFRLKRRPFHVFFTKLERKNWYTVVCTINR